HSAPFHGRAARAAMSINGAQWQDGSLSGGYRCSGHDALPPDGRYLTPWTPREDARDDEGEDVPRALRRGGNRDGGREPEAGGRHSAERRRPGGPGTRAIRSELSVRHRHRAVAGLHPARHPGSVGGRLAAGRVHGRRRGLQPAHDVRRPLSGRHHDVLRGGRPRTIPAESPRAFPALAASSAAAGGKAGAGMRIRLSTAGWFIAALLLAGDAPRGAGRRAIGRRHRERHGAGEEDPESLADLISVPFQNNFNFDTGPEQRTVWVLNVQPVIPVKLTDDWNLITRIIMPIINQPSLAPGIDSAFGVGDVNPTFFFSPVGSDEFIWGVGPTFTF